MDLLDKRTGSYQLNTLKGGLIWLLVGLFSGLVITKMKIMGGAAIMGLPFMTWFLVHIFRKPGFGMVMSLLMAFFASGLARYVKGVPWGMTIDVMLFLSWLGILFKNFRETDWSPIRNDLMMMITLWMGYLFLEIVNPEARSAVAWFYAMRGIGFYWLLGFGITFFYFRKARDLDRFLFIITFVSILGTLWGLRQQIFGTDAAEDYWLWVEEHYDEHVLFGVLRVFSFYSDAGQFGASQAMMALLCGIIAMGPGTMKKRLWYAFAAIMTFVGFGISGTRGALAVPAAGGILFLLMTKRINILILGLLAGGLVFGMLKYTMVLQSVAPVARMRTALDPDNPSLNARFRNQVTYRKYLASRPLGAGVGTAGYWGQRFSPGTVPAETPTDSWYVKIWAETGIVGLCFHVFFIGFFLGKGGNIVWNLEDQGLRFKVMAIYSSIGGVAIASYGNQVLGQMPTGIIVCMALPMIWMAPMYDQEIRLTEENKGRPKDQQMELPT